MFGERRLGSRGTCGTRSRIGRPTMLRDAWGPGSKNSATPECSSPSPLPRKTRRTPRGRSPIARKPSNAESLAKPLPSQPPRKRPGATAGVQAGFTPGGVYQIGDVQSRSWIVFGNRGSSHASGRPPSGSALHCQVVQRQLGFSSTRR